MRLWPKFAYPRPQRSNVSEILHGALVKDPYRWLEDSKATTTKAFIDELNSLSRSYVDDCANRQAIVDTIRAVSNFTQYSLPVKADKYLFFFAQGGDNNQPILYRQLSRNGVPEVFMDVNKLSSDGTVAPAGIVPSVKGVYIAYTLSESGSDWQTIQVKEVATGRDLDDRLERMRYSSIAWTHDEQGFFYGQYPDWEGQEISGTDSNPADNQKIYYHLLGTNQDKDVLVMENPNYPKSTYQIDITPDGKRLVISGSEGTDGNQVFVADIPQTITGPLPLKQIQGTFESELEFVTGIGDDLYFRTNKNRPNYALVKIDIKQPDHWLDVIPEDPKRTLDRVDHRGKDKFVLCYSQDVASVVEIFDLQGKYLQRLPFDLGDVTLNPSDTVSNEVFFSFESFLSPPVIYYCYLDNVPSAQLIEYRREQLAGWSAHDVIVKQDFYTSSNHTRVPMFIMHRSNQTLDSSAPALLDIYGGFGVSIPPAFSPFKLFLIYTLGFVIAVANVRGGGEYGERWHKAGQLANKQNTLDDVHYAARYLSEQGYTSPGKIVLTGRSNGGFVTLASINQQPELFGLAIAEVPVADLLRFHRFTVGYAWTTEYGNPDNATEFEFIRRLSPLHNIPTDLRNYPAVLVTTADHDDRVVPAHSLKFIAELQYRANEMARQTSGGNKTEFEKPFLAIIDTKAGHGDGKPLSKVIEEHVDHVCFLSNVLDLSFEKRFFENITTSSSVSGS